MIYQGEHRPPLNPDLVICAEYKPDQTSRLIWFRMKERGFCERWGEYSFDGKTLNEKIVRVNPDNAAECGKDPDMAVGHVTSTPVEIIEGRLHLRLQLGEEKLVYIWKAIETCPSTATPPP